MASIQAAALRTSSLAGHALVGQVKAASPKQCATMAVPLLARGSVSQQRIVSQSSESSFVGARFSGVPSSQVKALSARRRQCAVRASEGRDAARKLEREGKDASRKVERESKNIFENIVDFFKSIINAILKFFSSIFGGIARLFRSNEDSARGHLRSAGERAEGAGKDVGRAGEDAIDALGDKGKDLKRNISDGLDDASSRLKRA